MVAKDTLQAFKDLQLRTQEISFSKKLCNKP